MTWPGYLAVVGDIANGYVFSRIADMLDFFDSARRDRYSDGCPVIDLRYWAEKLCGGSDTNDCQACSIARGADQDGVCGPVAAGRVSQQQNEEG